MLESFLYWKTLWMQSVVSCTLSQHQHSRCVRTAPMFLLIKESTFQRLSPTQHVQILRFHNSCDLILEHRGGSRNTLVQSLGCRRGTATEK